MCVLLLAALVVRVTLAQRPLAGLGRAYVVGGIALAVLATWVLASAAWSDAQGSATLEYDRALLYLLAFVLFGALGRTPDRLRWMVRGLAAGAVVVCVAGLITRTLPDVWEVAPTVANDRLSYPLTYWNALGLLAAMGVVLCVALTCDAREHPATRVAAAAPLPLLGATLLLTFSRASLVLAPVACLVLLAVGRPRFALSGLLVAVPVVGFAVAAAYGAGLLASDTPTTPAATEEGHDLALVLAGLAVLAAAARAALLVVDERLAGAVPRVRLPAALRRPPLLAGAAAGLLAVVAGIAVAAGAPGAVERQYDRFVKGDQVQTEGDLRERLTQVGNNGRIRQWRVSVDAFESEPLHGAGAGTYARAWDRERREYYEVKDAHSLYLEMLGELGVVGLLLVVVAIGVVLGGFAARSRGPDRAPGAALLACGLAWATHAGVDWDWEMPAVTLWFFAAGGLAVAAPVSAGAGASPAPRVRGALRLAAGDLPTLARVVVGAACLLAAVVPVRVWLADRALGDSARAFARGDCPRTIDRALDARSILGARPEPLLLLGYCDVRIGRPDLAVQAMSAAVREDRHDWQTHYGLALAQASAGRDPRPAVRLARRLNPFEDVVRDAQERFDTDDPRLWRRRALGARLPTG